MKKIDDKEEIVEEEKDPGDAYKEDGWWTKLTDRINRVGECVRAGKDLETEDEEDQDEEEDQNKAEKDQAAVQGSKDVSQIEERLDKQEKSLECLSSQMDQLSGLVSSQSQLLQQLLIQLNQNNIGTSNQKH